jgi:hypothetical protein
VKFLKKGLRPLPFFLAFIAMFTITVSRAQRASGDVSLRGTTTKPYEFTTYDQLENGGTAIMYAEVGFSIKKGAYLPNWKLSARVTGPFRNGADFIDPHLVSIQFNTVVGGPSGSDIGIPTNPFPLSLGETTIIPSSNVPLDGNADRDFEIVYDMIIQGGNHLIALPNGEYRTDLSLTLYDEFGLPVGVTETFTISFEIRYVASSSSSLRLLNGADIITLQFNSGADLTNGVSVFKPFSLLVSCQDPHQIMVKASSSHLLGSGTNNTIPVSAITLTIDKPPTVPRVICFSRSLSINSSVFIDNPMTTNDYRDVGYDLTFSIAGNDPNIVAAPIGTYTTSIVFVIVPK